VKYFGEIPAGGHVSTEDRSFRKIEFRAAKMLCVAVAPWGKGNLDRAALSGGYHVDFQVVEEATFAAACPL
jgi:hypothetical protein